MKKSQARKRTGLTPSRYADFNCAPLSAAPDFGSADSRAVSKETARCLSIVLDQRSTFSPRNVVIVTRQAKWDGRFPIWEGETTDVPLLCVFVKAQGPPTHLTLREVSVHSPNAVSLGDQGVRHIFRPTALLETMIFARKMSQTPPCERLPAGATRDRRLKPRCMRPVIHWGSASHQPRNCQR